MRSVKRRFNASVPLGNKKKKHRKNPASAGQFRLGENSPLHSSNQNHVQTDLQSDCDRMKKTTAGGERAADRRKWKKRGKKRKKR